MIVDFELVHELMEEITFWRWIRDNDVTKKWTMNNIWKARWLVASEFFNVTKWLYPPERTSQSFV